MIWKDSYRIGVDNLDQQHHELFEVAERLLKTLLPDNAYTYKEDHKAAFAYIRQFVDTHFNDEEAYQRSIGCKDYDEHKRAHDGFRLTVGEYCDQLEANDYDLKTVKEFSGVLVAWLVYHVAGIDQHMVPGTTPEEAYLDCFSKSLVSVFETMFGLQGLVTSQVAKDEAPPNDSAIFAKIPMVGDLTGEAVFSFKKETALYLLNVMACMEQDEIDELVCSAMAEVANIVSGNAVTELLSISCTCDIRPPVISTDGFETEFKNSSRVLLLETPAGRMGVEIFQ